MKLQRKKAFENGGYRVTVKGSFDLANLRENTKCQEMWVKMGI
jgi:hypothetical protein